MGNFVIVACKLPSGLNIGGNLIKGQNHVGDDPNVSVRGFVLTSNFPRDVWDEWLKINKDSDLVKKHNILAGDTMDEVKAAIFRLVGARSAPLFGSKPYPGGQ